MVRTVVKSATDVKPGTVSMSHSWGDLPGEQRPVADPFTAGDTTAASRLYVRIRSITGLPVMSAIQVSVRGARAVGLRSCAIVVV